MGKKKIITIDDSQTAKKAVEQPKVTFDWEHAYTDLSPRTAKALRAARIKPEQLRALKDGEILSTEGIGPKALEEIKAHYSPQLTTDQEETVTDQKPTKAAVPSPKPESQPRRPRHRSRLYQAKKSLIENKSYPITDAVSLLRQVTYSQHKTVELHLNVTETGLRGEITLPHSVGQKTKVAIFSPELAAKIKQGKIDFDILLATPKDMTAVAPLAKILGPRGLMPNPKSNTIVSDPVKRKQQLEAGATLSYRSEPKAPLIHLRLGHLDLPDDHLTANLNATLQNIGRSKIHSAYLKSTMSPSIRLDLSTL